MSENRFYEELKKMGLNLSIRQKEQFQMYFQLLVEWNQKINLTTIIEKNQVYLKHFYDSATLVKVINFHTLHKICDIGTGAGFPGIVLKILFPELEVTLVDSLNKRILFLQEVIKTLQLKNIELIHTRAEEYALSHREEFDMVTSRAVSSLPILLEYSIPMVKVGQYFIPLKGDIAQEIKDSKEAMRLLNVKLECQEQFELPIEQSKRTILKFKKEKETSVKYPRKFSEIKKRPL